MRIDNVKTFVEFLKKIPSKEATLSFINGEIFFQGMDVSNVMAYKFSMPLEGEFRESKVCLFLDDLKLKLKNLKGLKSISLADDGSKLVVMANKENTQNRYELKLIDSEERKLPDNIWEIKECNVRVKRKDLQDVFTLKNKLVFNLSENGFIVSSREDTIKSDLNIPLVDSMGQGTINMGVDYFKEVIGFGDSDEVVLSWNNNSPLLVLQEGSYKVVGVIAPMMDND
jgi:hypothetical protein